MRKTSQPFVNARLVLAILVGAFALLATGSARADNFGNVMFLGDSITQAASTSHQSYRYDLWKHMIDHGDSFNFVGSLQNNFNESNGNDTSSSSSYPTYSGQTFDKDHEGHWGWRTGDVLGTRTPQFGPGSGTGTLANWLTNYTPDTAVILLGVNDIKLSVGFTAASTAANMQTIINTIKSDNPSVRILLASVLPCTSGFANPSTVQQLNGMYQSIAASNSGVTFVDVGQGVDVATYLYDGVHPNAFGEQVLADRFYNALTGSAGAVGQAPIFNKSFELPDRPPVLAATSIDGWVKTGPGGNGAQGVVGNQWNGGVANAPNIDGDQLGWMNTDVTTMVSQSIADQFTVGRSYALTFALGKAAWNPPNADDQIQVQLFYDNNGTPVVISSVSATASMLNDSQGNLTDFTAMLPPVKQSDAWSGKYIGLRVISTFEGAAGGDGDWVFDNARLAVSAVPEPGTIVLVATGCLAAGFRPRRRKIA